MIQFPSDQALEVDPLTKARRALHNLRIRRDKLASDFNKELIQLKFIVAGHSKGDLLLDRIKAHTIFSIQRVKQHVLARSIEGKSEAERLDFQAKFYRLSIRILKSSLEDVRAMTKASSSAPPVSEVIVQDRPTSSLAPSHSSSTPSQQRERTLPAPLRVRHAVSTDASPPIAYYSSAPDTPPPTASS